MHNSIFHRDAKRSPDAAIPYYSFSKYHLFSSTIREWIKIHLVNLLITRRKVWHISNRRHIRLGSRVTIEDSHRNLKGYRYSKSTVLRSYHMASQGYWQIRDETSA